MPATAGRVRMPPNNRMHSSAALQTHSIWQSVIGYDPYAPIKDEPKQSSSSQPLSAVGPGPDVKNPYDNFKDIMRGVAASNTDVGDRGGCKKCGRVGHLSFQCRNFINLKVEKQENAAVLQVDTGSGMNKFKLNGAEELSDEESSEESEGSDSDVDSEIERAIAERKGKTGNRTKMTSLNKKRDESDEDRQTQDRKKRDRSKKRKCKRRIRSDTDHDEGSNKKRKRRENKKKRRLDDSSDDEDRRSHLYRKSKKEKTRRKRYHDSTDDSDSDEESKRHHKRRHRKKASSNSDVSD